MEFTSTPPPTLPSYRARCQAIVTLNNTHDGESTSGEPLARTTSRGSIGSLGRRLSFGKSGDGATAEDKERGAGLRSFGRRQSGDAGREDATGGSALGRTKSRDGKSSITGKWATNVEVAVTPTHMILLLTPEHPLAPFPPPPGAPGYKERSSSASHDAAEGGGIKEKIKGLFKGHSDAAAADHSTAGKTASPTPAVAPTPDQATRAFPAYVNGQATTCVMVPIAAIKESEVQLVDDKREIGVRVPISSHFSTLVHGMLDNLGKEQDESWGRSGKIKFDFDRNWIGAKGEAETLYNNITQAIFDRRNNPAGTGQTLNLGAGHGASGQAAHAPAATAAPATATTTAAPATTASGLGHGVSHEGGLTSGHDQSAVGHGTVQSGPGNTALGNPIIHTGDNLSGRKVPGDAL